MGLRKENVRLRRALREMVDDESLYGPDVAEEEDGDEANDDCVEDTEEDEEEGDDYVDDDE